MILAFDSISDEGMQVVTPPMDTIQEESEATPTRANSQHNVNSNATSPVMSPRHARKHNNAGHLHNNLIASLSGIRSTLNLSRGQFTLKYSLHGLYFSTTVKPTLNGH